MTTTVQVSVARRKVQVTVDKAMKYVGEDDPTFTYTVSGEGIVGGKLPNGEQVALVGALDRSETVGEEPGVYDVDDGTLTKAEVTYSDLGQTKAKFTEAPEAGTYTLVIATRCGLGTEFGVVTAERKISVK